MRSEVKYGLIGGGVMIIWELIEWVTGVHGPHQALLMLLGVASALVSAVILFYGLKARRQELGGFLPMKEGWKSSLRIGLVMGVVGALFMMLYINYINPSYKEDAAIFQRNLFVSNMQKQQPEVSDHQAERLALKETPVASSSQVVLTYFTRRVSITMLVGLFMTMVWRQEYVLEEGLEVKEEVEKE